MRAPAFYRLGIVGGLGPLAAADLYRKVTLATAAASDQAHIPIALMSIPQTPDRTAAILGAGASPLPILAAAVQALDALGVELILIACNTAHHWFDALAEWSRAPILHIADAAVAALAGHGTGARVALLGTRGVLASGFYQRRIAAHGYVPLAPADDLQGLIDGVIAAVKGGDLPTATALMDAVPARLAPARPDAILLACTELPLAWNGSPLARSSGLPAIDVTEAHARAAIQCLGYPLRWSCVVAAGECDHASLTSAKPILSP